MNIVKKTFAYPKNRVCKITTICLIGNYKLTLFFLEKSDEVRCTSLPTGVPEPYNPLTELIKNYIMIENIDN